MPPPRRILIYYHNPARKQTLVKFYTFFPQFINNSGASLVNFSLYLVCVIVAMRKKF